ncbi:DUF4153 domain-containing protein [Thalassospira sp. TSL5-1]|uniref:DUF4153 domain-containing protein n=1 Tax=Thalassospira sp. TSL5-1 TaxID=1544451 RepID=UPI00093A4A45|nr:DUF4153 domain-containing protein [Thalassospira sp. TSL5-1]OKH87665.1 hypothetical protein LF95_12980 [Thalassospira sp. TSL5-1]
MSKFWWLFPLSGGLYGVAAWYLFDQFDEQSLFVAPLAMFVAASAYGCWFALTYGRLSAALAFTGLVAVLAAGQVAVFQHIVGFDYLDDMVVFGFFVSQIAWVGLLVALWRARYDATDHEKTGAAVADAARGPIWHVPYRAIGPAIWDVKLSLAFGLVSIGVFWIMAYVLGTLFNVVGFTAFMDFLQSALGGSMLTGAAFATGIMLTREKPALLKAVRQVLGTLYRFFYPLQAAGVFLFLLLGALGGWEQLLGRDTSISMVVLAAALWISYLLFGAVQSGATTTLFGRWGDVVFRYSLWMAPVCALAALGCIWLRVEDYWLTPLRLYATWLGLYVLGATVWIMRAGMIRGDGMISRVQRAFGQVAVGGIVVAFVMHLPWLDPVSISAASQQTRLGLLNDMPKADLAFMARQLGKPGEEALTTLRTENPDRVPDIEELRNYYPAYEDVQTPSFEEIPVFPQNHPFSDDDLRNLIDHNLQYDRMFCQSDKEHSNHPDDPDHPGQGNKCALLLVDLDGDGQSEAVFFSLRNYAPVFRFRPARHDWIKLHDMYRETGRDDAAMDAATLAGNMLEALQKGAFSPEKPVYSDLSVGGARWQQSR